MASTGAKWGVITIIEICCAKKPNLRFMKTPSAFRYLASHATLLLFRLIRCSLSSLAAFCPMIANGHFQNALPSAGSETYFSPQSGTGVQSILGNSGTGTILPDAPPLGASNQGVNFSENFVNNGFKDANGNNLYPFIHPPDNHAAVGPNHVVTAVNGTLRIYKISTGTLARNFRLGSLLGSGNPSSAVLDGNGNTILPANSSSAFFAALTPANQLFDSRVVYDQLAQRFIVITLERVNSPSSTVSRILIAASPVATAPGFDPSTAVWNYRAVNAKETVSATGVEYWADYPTAAVDGEALYITTNMFPCSGNSSIGSRVWIITKAQLYNSITAGTATATRYDPFALAGFSTEHAYGSAPAHIFGANGVLNGNGTYLA